MPVRWCLASGGHVHAMCALIHYPSVSLDASNWHRGHRRGWGCVPRTEKQKPVQEVAYTTSPVSAFVPSGFVLSVFTLHHRGVHGTNRFGANSVRTAGIRMSTMPVCALMAATRVAATKARRSDMVLVVVGGQLQVGI